MAVLQRDPTNAEAFLLLGVLAADHDNHAKAIELFDRARARGFDVGVCEAHAARSALALNRREEAVARVHRAKGGADLDAATLDTIGVVFSRLGLHEDAISQYRAATAAAPEVSSYWYNLGAALQFLGEFDEADDAFRRCLAVNPGDTRAMVARVSISKQTADQNDIDALHAAWTQTPEDSVDARLQIAHALAKCHEDLGQPLDAMAWLARGKAPKHRQVGDRESEDHALFAMAGCLAKVAQVESAGSLDGPIFITGMPRTGTTLVDRILSSHPRIRSAGELSDFSVLLKRALGTPGPYVLDAETLSAAGDADLLPVGAAYINRVQNGLGIEGRFTDKMPLNIFFAPAILKAIPNAQIICLRRHPADTALSNYRQLFATSFSYYTYAYDLEQTARYVVNFNLLIETYRQALPPERFKIVDYENILSDQEHETRALLEFGGLEFDPACLHFHENKAPVATASAAQVRQPLYSTSRDRWRRYRPSIDPALEILTRAGLMDRSDWR